MCIIAAKPAGAKLPHTSDFRRMWEMNPDGAGFMYAQNGRVHIVRGMMTWDDFAFELARVKKFGVKQVESMPMVFHFRICTHGGIQPQFTHPYVVGREDTRYDYATTRMGIAHNGIIPGYGSKEISDTAEFNATLLHDMQTLDEDFVYRPEALLFLSRQIGPSRLAFLTGKGDIIRVGHGWVRDEKRGIWYSNPSLLTSR